MNRRGTLCGGMFVRLLVSLLVLLCLAWGAQAVTYYVDASRPDDSGDGLSWATAKHTIQAAVNVAGTNEALIRVSDGIQDDNSYVEFVRVIDPGPHCTSVYRYHCLYVDGPITIQSENGPETAIIKANASTTSGNIGGIVLINGAKLIGFTVMNARTHSGSSYRVSYSSCGRGITALDSMVSNCIVKNNGDVGISGGLVYNTKIMGNSAGGVYRGEYHHCLMADNLGTGASGTLYNCTVVGNHAPGNGGGVTGGDMYNCIVWGNTCDGDPATANYSGGNFNYCCTDPMPTSGAVNISSDPQMMGDGGHISSNSPCFGAGLYMYCSGVDIDGEFWRDPPSIGCDEVLASSSTGALVVAINSAARARPGVALPLAANVTGTMTSNVWDFGDGSYLFNQSSVEHVWSESGIYDVVFTAYGPDCSDGVSVTQPVTVSEYDGILYVDADSGDDTWDGTRWVTAKRTIQAAVDAASGQTVLIRVAAGIYADGGMKGVESRVNPYTQTNRVYASGPITIQSVEGPAVTVIEGAPDSDQENGMGPAAIRGVSLLNGAKLDGFTVTKGYTALNSSVRSGGVRCDSNSLVRNCIIKGNFGYYGGGVCGGTLDNCLLQDNYALFGGGGAYLATLINCRLVGNVADDMGIGYFGGPAGGMGGGAQESTLVNCLLRDNISKRLGGGAYDCVLSGCTVVRNSAYLQGGGTYESVQNNCIVFENTTTSGMYENYYAGTLSYCCTEPLPLGVGNIAENPKMTDVSHISANSPCIGAGSSAHSSHVDLDGEAWQNPPSIGCDEYAATATGTLAVVLHTDHTRVAVDHPQQWRLQIDGHALSNKWMFGDGEIYENCLSVTHGWDTPGEYSVVALVFNTDHPDGIATTQEVSVASEAAVTYYVRQDSVSPAPPYASWETAAHTIQDAVDQAMGTAGAIVRVDDGCYRNGGAAAPGETLTNRIYASGPVTIQSEHGPELTIIEGAADIAGCSPSNGSSAVRGAYLSRKAALIGFTVTNGYTDSRGSTTTRGGGIFCVDVCMVSNCVLTGNNAVSGGGACDAQLYNCRVSGNYARYGGGVFRGTLHDCVVEENIAGYQGGGGFWSLMDDCVISGNVASNSAGGGVHRGVLNNCFLSGNKVLNHGYGGGANGATLNNCVVTGNHSDYKAGGAYYCMFRNSTIFDNTASEDGGGSYLGTMNNCIVWGNQCSNNPATDNYYAGIFNYSCIYPLSTNGVGNISSDPCLIDASHIASNSPCIGAGSRAYVSGVDIDGDEWLNPPSIGCDEPAAGSSTGTVTISFHKETANPAVGVAVAFSVDVTGGMTSNRWDFGDGTIIEDETSVSHAWLAEGMYQLVFTAYGPYCPQGKTVTQTILVALSGETTYYVDASRPDDSGDGLSWATAKQTIQAGVELADNQQALIRVAAGSYDLGGCIATQQTFHAVTNRVWAKGPVTIQSEDGPGNTFIVGCRGTNGYSVDVPLGDTAVRGVCLEDGARIIGFTITNGFTTGHYYPWSGAGGGIMSDDSCVISNCIITGCGAMFGGGASGGTLYNCILTGNKAEYHGGGAHTSILYDCVLMDNSNADRGGGAYGCQVYNGVLKRNSARDGGGADYCILHDSVLEGNNASSGGGGASGSTLYDCTFRSNYGSHGGGVHICQVFDGVFEQNTADGGGGSSGGELHDCVFLSNSAGFGGGAQGGVFYNCRFENNQAKYKGGGASGGTLYNCELVGNAAHDELPQHLVGGLGGGTVNSTLHNCTLVGNSAVNGGGGCHSGTMCNSIVWGNSSSSNPAAANYSDAAFEYCCTYPLPTSGVGNISSDPLFVDPASGDYRLQAGSPCFNAGDNATVPATLTSDLAGNPRIQFGLVDMGAYERVYEAYALFVRQNQHGTIFPTGSVIAVQSNENVSFSFVPDEWFEMGDVLINGVSIGAVDNYLWTNMMANGTVDVHFAATPVAGCPHPLPRHWMARHGLTTNMAAQADEDQDGDGCTAWEEYIMDTVPTDGGSVLSLDGLKADPRCPGLAWQASAERSYSVYWTTDLTAGFTNVLFTDYRPAASGRVSYTNGMIETDQQVYYRIKAVLP